MEGIYKAEKRYTLAERVIEQVRSAIISGKIKPGERLIEKEIADALQIGRNAVREAFRCLEREGYLTITPFKGASVARHDKEQIRQMFEVMSELEGVCARLAINRMTRNDLDRIESLHEALEKHYRNNEPQKYLEINWSLHEFIQKLTKNDVLNKLIDELRLKINLYRKQQLYLPNRFGDSINEHRQIIDAFRKKDANAAEFMMRQHLLKQGTSLTKIQTWKS
jgi:DNA-binding GntR family transcriptional regulator